MLKRQVPPELAIKDPFLATSWTIPPTVYKTFYVTLQSPVYSWLGKMAVATYPWGSSQVVGPEKTIAQSVVLQLLHRA